MAFELIATIALVLANAFFVAMEFAIARLRPTQVDELERQGKPFAGSVRHAVEHIDAYLAACQLGITLASLGLGAVGKPVFTKLLEPLLGESAGIAGFGLAATTAFLIITLLHVVVGELSPKSLAIARPAPTSLMLAFPMRAFYVATRPAVDLFNGMGNLLLKPFGIPPASEAGHAPHSEDELRELLRQSSREGLIDPEERRFTENVFSFGDRRAREVMRPRPEVDFVTTEASLADAARQAISTGHTRLPLCEPDGGLDAPVGLLNAKDILQATVEDGDGDLSSMARPLARVPESTLIDELLRELRRNRRHLALVVDEHGTTVGLVTLEDIIEEIVGEIEDEFDVDEEECIRREGSTALVKGSTALREVEEQLGLRVSEPHEATIGGHLLELLGRLPGPGEEIELEDRRVEVVSVDEARIAELRIPLDSAAAGDHAGGGGPERAGGDGRRATG